MANIYLMDGILQCIVLYYYNFNIWRFGFRINLWPIPRPTNRHVQDRA